MRAAFAFLCCHRNCIRYGLFLFTVLIAGTVFAAEPPSFANDIVPLLTKASCNQGACHGKNDGRNGFKLSLRGYAPDWDWERLVKESRGRRINLAAPEQSLLLRKASGQVPHGGGALLPVDSPGYDLLKQWIAAGAPSLTGNEPQVSSLELTPGPQILNVGDQRQIRVQARYTDNTVRDVTWLTQFFSNDGNVIDIQPTGLLTAVRPGETSIRAHFMTQVETCVMTVPMPGVADTQADTATMPTPAGFIDEWIFKKLSALRIPASPDATDVEFMRRVYLDLIGTLPTAAEVRQFIQNPSTNKREQLIDQLLARPEYIDYWTLFYADLLQNRRERDHDVRGAKDVRRFQAWIRQKVADNTPWDQLAREVLTSQGSADEHPAVGYFVVTVGEKQRADESEVVASVAQAFLGTRIGCAQCHNHPLERYTQDDYYHFAAFFASLKLKRENSRAGATELTFEWQDKNQKIAARQPRTGKMMPPQTLDRQPAEMGDKLDPRENLAKWITGAGKEQFASAMVNRLWRHMYGTGLVEPVDDLRASNPPSHPELMHALTDFFISHNYDVKALLREMANSRAYQLSSRTLPGNAADSKFYSHYAARRLPAEVLFDAICQATDQAQDFAGYPRGLRAIQLPEPKVESYFLSQFGRSDRVTACACERKNDLSVTQLLHLQCGPELWDKVTAGEGRLAKLLAPGDPAAASTTTSELPESAEQAMIEELYLHTLSRFPEGAEMKKLRQVRQSSHNKTEFFQDLFWALLNSKEFSFNH
ncbi:MAG: DUF1549 domain-containing protein [Pirellulales bacterium]|nr:DUF1549 domain-containing protein [Pirellulales bacterium]